MSNHNIIYQIFVVRASLICWCPSSSCNLELSIFYKFLEFFFIFLFLSCVPHLKILRFRKGKSSLWIICKFINNTIQNHFDKSSLKHTICTWIIIIKRFFKTACFWVWNNMSYNLFVFYTFFLFNWCSPFRMARLISFFGSFRYHFYFFFIFFSYFFLIKWDFCFHVWQQWLWNLWISWLRLFWFLFWTLSIIISIQLILVNLNFSFNIFYLRTIFFYCLILSHIFFTVCWLWNCRISFWRLRTLIWWCLASLTISYFSLIFK